MERWRGTERDEHGLSPLLPPTGTGSTCASWLLHAVTPAHTQPLPSLQQGHRQNPTLATPHLPHTCTLLELPGGNRHPH